MSQTAVLVWLSASSLSFGVSGEAGAPTFRADLDAFAQARLLRLEAPRENAASFRSSAYAPDAVAQLESSLEEARNAAGALEQSRALTALERAEHLLRDHAELPQSSWLMAEILELSADVESTAPDGADAERALRKRAAALEGPRATPFSDRATTESEVEVEAPIPIEIQGLESNDTLEWDGRQCPASFSTAPGEHHARVARNGRLMWAGWTRVAANAPARPNPTQLRLPVPETVACSPDDIGQGRFVASRAIPAPHARCDSYVLARPRPMGGIEVAVCERESCGPIVIWEHSRAGTKPGATGADKKHIWPYAVAITAGVLAVTGVVLWRAGVFDRPEATTHEAWVYSPPSKPMAFRF
ncbi:MAG: hypothetical protein ABUL62_13680 [Myxococcales bacterium]